ncbi:MAG: DUF2961 domain-containing protein [Planctomycetes bacterium]|nr:DUF2961 domain-containing protein [Planctomycetota bacterium]
MRRPIVLAATLLVLPPSPAEADGLRYADLLRALVDLDALPFLEEGVRCAQFSSYDRASQYDPATGTYRGWDANVDTGNYLRIDETTGEGIMADIEGPGCIVRIWSARPQGRIRFRIDGAPPLEFDFDALFSGRIEPFRRPLVWQRRVALGGDNPASDCYLPIPFAKRCIVAADRPHEQYYHIGYKTYPKDWTVPSFAPPLTAEDREVLSEVCAIWERPGADPQPAPSDEKETAVALEGGEEATLFALEGPAVIRSFRARIRGADPHAIRNVLLRFFWDGEATPSVETPLGDFFGAGLGMAPYAALPLGVTADGEGYSYFRMPFRRSARLVAVNEGRGPVDVASRIAVRRAPGGALPEATGLFHAKWRRELPCIIFEYPMLECWGRGRFVGVVLGIDNVLGGWWGEGDERAYVDGERFPSTFGTGSEDYFGDAWGIRAFVNPLHGCSREVGRKQVCYRFHIPDAIPFTSSFRMTIENYSAKEGVRNGYDSIAYWYATEPSRDFFRYLPAADRLPTPPRLEPGAVEVERAMRPLPSGAAPVEDERLSWAGGVRLAGEAGATFPLTILAPEAGAYAFELGLAPGTAPGACEAVLDGEPLGRKAFLRKGRNEIALRLVRAAPAEGGAGVVADYVRITPWRRFVRVWRVAGPFPNEGRKGLDRAYGPEADPSASATYPDAIGGPAGWRTIEAPEDGGIDLAALFRPNEFVVAYAAVTVLCPDDRKDEILLGSDDGVKVFLNGDVVHALAVHRGLGVDVDRFPVSLRKGANALLVKVEQGPGAWGLRLRFRDPKDELEFRAE